MAPRVKAGQPNNGAIQCDAWEASHDRSTEAPASRWSRARAVAPLLRAACSGEVMEAMLASGIDYTIFFYNPNIHPLRTMIHRSSRP